MIKVLRVITRLNVGGPSKQIFTLSSLFDGKDFEQLIVTGRVLDSEREIDLISLGNVTRISTLQRGFNPINEIRCVLQIAKVIRQYKPNLIHTHLSKAWALTILAKIFSGAQCKVIHTFHGHILHSYFSKSKEVLVNLVQKFLASKSDYLVAVNDLTKRDLIAAKIGSEEKFKVIYPGFKALYQHSKVHARNRLGLIDNLFTVGFVGRFEKVKRPDILSKVINMAIESSNSIQFVVCGGGELYEDFQIETSNPKVHCFPWTQDLSLLYSSVDLMLLTSDNEGSPLTIIEAGQFGVPTLSRRVGGVPSLISHELTGFLADDDPESIAKTLSRISCSPDFLLEVSTKTKEYFGQNFNELTFLNSYKSLYIEAASD